MSNKNRAPEASGAAQEKEIGSGRGRLGGAEAAVVIVVIVVAAFLVVLGLPLGAVLKLILGAGLAAAAVVATITTGSSSRLRAVLRALFSPSDPTS
ncbi:hypothetical protein [Streptomyces sp. NPDC021562]|uniref:hypothetical protein n=1 Tax=Streptomyces sp. NPDC021562 TaxID=3155121 RepID=UPI0034119289